MAKKSFKKNAQNSLGGIHSVLQNTTKQDSPPTVEEKEEKKRPEVGAKSTPKSPPTKRSQASAKKKEDTPASEKGCKEGDTRKTFIIRKELAEKMQDIAYWEPGKLKDHMNAALEAYVKRKWSRKRPKDA
ncbi:MAG: hypothetical protein AAF587_06125 [Bacteroidota bacterium]